MPERVHAAAEGQPVGGVHISLVPSYFDLAETAGLVRCSSTGWVAAPRCMLIPNYPYSAAYEDLRMKKR